MTELGDFPTITEQDSADVAAAARQPVLGFVVFWCLEQPAHTGAFIPVLKSAEGRPQILGRGGALATDEYGRLESVLQRPSLNLALPPFSSAAISRSQLHVTVARPKRLRVVNIGKCPLFLNGASITDAEVGPGDLLEVGRQLALLCVERPLRLEGSAGLVQHLFGEPDRHGIVGESPAAWELRLAITAIGARPGHVLILGASGTGKELIAQAIHSESASSGALVARNASTLPESILDAELFGNLKGYPNPGMAERAGLFGAADGGSLFLDEIAELPISAQTHLLRVLDAGEYQRLGATTLCRSAFRLIAATNQPESSLRADVRARFTFRIQVPDLARRREDIPLIARYLLRKMGDDDPKLRARLFTQAREARLSPPLIRHLASHPFSSNVRELRNLLWEAAVMGTGNALERGEPSAAPTDRAVEKSASAEPDSDPEPSHLQRVLDAHNGSIDRTWRALGLPSRFAMMRLIKKHGLRIKKEARQD